MRVITVSREFGSGGRELGKRMADSLHFSYYDKEIMSAIARESNQDETYVEAMMGKEIFHRYPITVGRTLVYPAFLQQTTTNILIAQQKILKTLAEQGDCVVMGQSADVILQEYQPFKIFVYADLPAKMQRCKERAPEGENLTDKELVKRMKLVDASRTKSREMLSGLKWGRKESYHLCVNTTGISIKTLAPYIAEYAKYWLGIHAT